MERVFLSLINDTANFDMLGFMVAPYTNILGDYFWLLMGVMPVGMAFLKSQSIAIPVMMGILFAAAFGFVIPKETGVMVLMLLGTGAGVILFRVFKTGGG